MYDKRGKSFRVSSPLPEPATTPRSKNFRIEINRIIKLGRYCGRLLKLNHMDFEFAMWQMIYLFFSPSKIYQNMCYRKKIKNQYSRDDPAFLVLLSIWFIISASALSITLRLSFISFIRFLFWVIFVDCIGIGLIVATFFWFIANKFLRKNTNEQVEWAFAFDIHLNAFFPPLVIIHFFQLLIYSFLIDHEWFLARFFGNTLFLIAVLYYLFITFLGYSSLPYLKNTEKIIHLTSMAIIFLIYFYTLIFGPNICIKMMYFYKYRVL